MIKLLALDMDGTLLNEAKEIPQAHTDFVKKAHKQAEIDLVPQIIPSDGGYHQ